MAFDQFFRVFLAIFVVMDAFGNLPVFLHFMKRYSAKTRIHCAKETVIIAGAVLFVFLFFGLSILKYFNIDVSSFKIAGGIVLLILGLKFVLGLRLLESNAKDYEAAVVPIATPVITGPGVITTVILMTGEYGIALTAIASVINLFITYMILRNSNLLLRIIGRQGADVVSRIMGLILAAIAVTFIKQGWLGL